MADATSDGREERLTRENCVSKPDSDSSAMGNASGTGLQGRELGGSPDEWHGPLASGPTSEPDRTPLFPPSPGDSAAWADVTRTAPHLAPSVARRDAAAAAFNLAAILSPGTATAIESRLCRLSGTAGLAEVVAQAGAMVDEAQALTRLRNLADGLANRTRALRLLGNGVCPLAAAYAWRTLAASHGLRAVDLAALAAPDRNPTDPVLGGTNA
jgi:hypothetical protein